MNIIVKEWLRPRSGCKLFGIIQLGLIFTAEPQYNNHFGTKGCEFGMVKIRYTDISSFPVGNMDYTMIFIIMSFLQGFGVHYTERSL